LINDGLPDIYFAASTVTTRLPDLEECGSKDARYVWHSLLESILSWRGLRRLNGDGFLDLLVATTGDGVLCF